MSVIKIEAAKIATGVRLTVEFPGGGAEMEAPTLRDAVLKFKSYKSIWAKLEEWYYQQQQLKIWQ